MLEPGGTGKYLLACVLVARAGISVLLVIDYEVHIYLTQKLKTVLTQWVKKLGYVTAFEPAFSVEIK